MPLDERRERLIVDAVVVFDDVDAGQRKRAAERGELRHVQALRLHRSVGKRPVRRVEQRANAGDAVARSGEEREHVAGHVEPGERDVVPQRGVTEHHVDELRQVGADRLRGDRDVDAEAAGIRRFDCDDARDDLIENARLADRFERALHALLRGDRRRPRFDVALGTRDDVAGGQPARGHRHLRPGRRSPRAASSRTPRR